MKMIEVVQGERPRNFKGTLRQEKSSSVLRFFNLSENSFVGMIVFGEHELRQGCVGTGGSQVLRSPGMYSECKIENARILADLSVKRNRGCFGQQLSEEKSGMFRSNNYLSSVSESLPHSHVKGHQSMHMVILRFSVATCADFKLAVCAGQDVD